MLFREDLGLTVVNSKLGEPLGMSLVMTSVMPRKQGRKLQRRNLAKIGWITAQSSCPRKVSYHLCKVPSGERLLLMGKRAPEHRCKSCAEPTSSRVCSAAIAAYTTLCPLLLIPSLWSLPQLVCFVWLNLEQIQKQPQVKNNWINFIMKSSRMLYWPSWGLVRKWYTCRLVLLTKKYIKINKK